MKRVRPAPMGRAFRVVKRTAHLTVRIEERPVTIARVGAEREADEATTPPRRKKASASA
jgi:large subunit ribosomal protein L22